MTIHPFPRRLNRISSHVGPCPRRQSQPFDHTASPASETAAVWGLREDLEEMLDQGQPFAFLDFAAKALTEIRPHIGDYLAALRRSGFYETAMLATAMSWLASGVRPESVLDPDTPAWLVQLGNGRVVESKVCQENAESTSYLIGIELVGGQTGTMQARIDHAHHDALTNYFVTDDSADALARILAAVTRPANPMYVNCDPGAAVQAISRAVERYGSGSSAPESANPWPRNRPLLDFAISHFECVGA